MRTKATVGALLAGAAVASLVLAGCSSSSGTASGTTTTGATAASTTSTAGASTTTAVAPAAAPCTNSALLAAAQAAPNLGAVQSVVNFECAGSWAYANVTVGTGSAAFDAVIVLQAQRSGWTVANRGTACLNHLVPASLYNQACTTS